jgi:hypothetical protein
MHPFVWNNWGRSSTSKIQFQNVTYSVLTYVTLITMTLNLKALCIFCSWNNVFKQCRPRINDIHMRVMLFVISLWPKKLGCLILFILTNGVGTLSWIKSVVTHFFTFLSLCKSRFMSLTGERRGVNKGVLPLRLKKYWGKLWIFKEDNTFRKAIHLTSF